MAVARKTNPRKSKTRRKGRLSLDDPRWRPLEAEHKLLTERVGDPYIAALDLTEALRSDKVCCMWRRAHDGASAPVSSTFWANYELTYWSDGLLVTPRRDRPRGEVALPDGVILPAGRKMPNGYAVFYVSGPHVDKLWPPLAANTQKPEPDEAARLRKPGKPPFYDWPLVVAAELIRRAKAGERDPTATEMIKHCEDVLPGAYSPGLKEMQILLKRLLSGSAARGALARA